MLTLMMAVVLMPCAHAAVIRGHVREAATGEPLGSAVVSLEGTDLGDLTGSDGYFLVDDIPSGSYDVRFTAMGYEDVKREALVIGDTTITFDISLAASPINLKEQKITAQRAEFKREVNVSSLTMSRGQLRTTPIVVESDLFRSLQTLPGIVTTSDFSSASFVRGGNADQNLVLLDGVSIYNPTHLGGIFSIFDPDVITSAELLTGGFPAEYGGRLSSVLDIKTRDGNSKTVTGTLGSSLLASKLIVEGPIPSDTQPGQLTPRGSFFFSARRTYFDQVLKLIDYDFPYYFYDLTGKATFNYGDQAKIGLTGFVSSDRLDLGTGSSRVFVDWGNRIASASWQQFWSPRFSSTNFLTYNVYNYDIGIAGGLIDVRDTINEIGLRSNNTVHLTGDNELDFGLEASYAKFRYNAHLLAGFGFDITGEPVTTSGYFQAKLKPFSALLLQPGLRLDYYTIQSEFGRSHQWLPSPRLSFKYLFDDITALKGSVGRFGQYYSALYPEFSPVPSLFFWVPIFGENPPQYADHFILGGERWLDENTNVTLEGYYKRFGRMYVMNENFQVDSIETSLLDDGTGYSWGADVLLRRDWGKLTGWLSYSLCFARVQFDTLEYSPNYDRRHIFNLVLSYPLPWQINANLHFSYGSGLPYTSSVGYYRRWNYQRPEDRYRSGWSEIPGGVNANRYPDYHRLDLGLERVFTIGRTRLMTQVQVINVYDHKNLLLFQWDYGQTPPLRTAVNQLPILPSLGVTWSF